MASGTQSALNDLKCIYRASHMSDDELQFFADMAQSYIDNHPTLRNNSTDPNDDDQVAKDLRFIKANIAAHFLHSKDPLETAVKQDDSQATYMDGTAKMIGFHLTPFGRNAIALDKTNTLEQEGAEEALIYANVRPTAPGYGYGYYNNRG